MAIQPVLENLWLAKRQRFAVVGAGAAAFMLLSLVYSWPLWSALILVGWLYVGFVYGVSADLKREEWLVIPLPIALGAVAAFGWLRLYADWLVIVIVGSLAFGVAVYGLQLTMNIVNIATVRSVPLLRIASSVLSLSTFVIGFVLYYLLLYMQPSLSEWLVGVVVISWLCGWPVLWLGMSGAGRWWRSGLWASLAALLIGQIGAVLAMWPRSFMTSLVMASCLYIALGVIHYQEKRRVQKTTQRQYLSVLIVMIFVLYLVTTWYGA